MLVISLTCLLAGCGDPAPAPPPTPSSAKSPDGPFQSQAQAIHSYLVANLAHKPLVGYGGRRFTIRFEPEVQVEYSDSPAEEQATDASGPAPTEKPPGKKSALVRLVHWQVQKQESMKYDLELLFESKDGKWQLVDATNRYLGLKGSEGFKPAQGFKKLKVL